MHPPTAPYVRKHGNGSYEVQRLSILVFHECFIVFLEAVALGSQKLTNVPL